MKKTVKRACCLLLSVCMMMTMLPTSVSAEMTNMNSGAAVTAETAEIRDIDFGVISDDEKEITGAVPASGISENEVPAESGDVSGNVLAAVSSNIADPPLSDEGSAGGEITAFTELSEELRFQRGEKPALPESIEGVIGNETKEIPVTWESETDTTQPGLHAFAAKVGGNDTLAGGLETPTIAFVCTSAGAAVLRMARMAGAVSADSIEISTAAQLAEVAAMTNAGKLELLVTGSSENRVSLKLIKDLDLSAYQSGEGWIPIGISPNSFDGGFDGGGKTITGLKINRPAVNEQGLFGVIGNEGVVEKLGVKDVSITGKQMLGGIAGRVHAGGTVQSSFSAGRVAGDGDIGGLAGFVQGTVQSCYSSADAVGVNGVGGIAGRVTGILKNCYVSGDIAGSYNIGGIAGTAGYGGRINNCAALNLSVTGNAGDSGNVGRVTGFKDAGAETADNIAYEGIDCISLGAAADNGESKTLAQLKANNFFQTLFSDDPAWTYGAGKLPGFGAAISMPDFPVGQYFAGEGKSYKPYQISTPAQLAKLAELVNEGTSPYADQDCYYLLMNDIDLAEYGKGWNNRKGWIPIGKDISHEFQGNFNGNNKVITGLYIMDTSVTQVGLFGIMSGTVKSLGVEGAEVTGWMIVGGLAGAVDYGKVSGCAVTGQITATTNTVGGIAGSLSGLDAKIQNCYSAADINSRGGYAGGIVGRTGGSQNPSIISCCTTGTVSASGGYAGSVVGSLSAGKVSNCVSLTESVSGKDPNIGRIAGANNPGTLADNIAFEGMLLTVDGIAKTGVGNDGAHIDGIGRTAEELKTAGGFPTALKQYEWTYTEGRLPALACMRDVSLPRYISGNLFAGGSGTVEAPYEIATAAQLAKLAELVNTGVSPYADAGRYYLLTGNLNLSAYANADNGSGWTPIGSSTNEFRGSLDGNGKTITGLVIKRPSSGEQGLFGVIGGGSVKNLGVIGAEISGAEKSGGLTGILNGGEITGCFVTGNVGGTNSSGGIAGSMSGGSVQNCYTASAVSGNEKVGGIVGKVSSGSVQNCYAVGSVGGSTHAGGLAGSVESSGTVKSSAALNVSVGGAHSVGRVAGSGSTLLDNYAFSGMTGGQSSKTGRGTDGADIDAAGAVSAAFWTQASNWGNSVWDSSVWNISAGRLPTLKKAGDNQVSEPGIFLTPKNAAYFRITEIEVSYAHTGNPVMPVPVVKFGTKVLEKDVDYTVVYQDHTEIGNARVTIAGVGNYTGERTVNFLITDDNPDIAVVDAAKTAAEQAVYASTTQQAHAAEAAVKDYVKEIAEAAVGNSQVTVTVNKVDYVAPAEGDGDNPSGTNGSYTFTISLEKGGQRQTTMQKTVTISAAPYTGNSNALVLEVAKYMIISSLGTNIIFVENGADQAAKTAAVQASVNQVIHDNSSIAGVAAVITYSGNPDNYEIVLTRGRTSNPFTLSIVIMEVPDLDVITVGNAKTAAESAVYSNMTQAGASGEAAIVNALKTAAEGAVNDSTVRVAINKLGYMAAEAGDADAPDGMNGSYTFTVTVEKGVQSQTTGQKSITITAAPFAGISNAAAVAAAKAAIGNGTVYVQIGADQTAKTAAVQSYIDNQIRVAADTAGVTAVVTYGGGSSYDAAISKGSARDSKGLIIMIAEREDPDMTAAAKAKNAAEGAGYRSMTQAEAAGEAAIANALRAAAEAAIGDSSVGVLINKTDYTAARAGTADVPNGTDGSYSFTVTVVKGAIRLTTGQKQIGIRAAVYQAPPAIPETPAAPAPSAAAPASSAASPALSAAVLAASVPSYASSEIVMQGTTAELTENTLGGLVRAGVESLVIRGGPIMLTLDYQALQEMQKQSTGNIRIVFTPQRRLSKSAKAAVGKRPVYDITVSDGSGRAITDLGSGTAAVAIPYLPQKDENMGALYAVYVDTKGKAVRIAGSVYDQNSASMLFTTSHFSVYGVSCGTLDNKYKDISSHWAKEAIDYAAGRGLLSGGRNGKFRPDDPITRGDFIKALGKMADITEDVYQKNGLTNLEKGIFAQPITRQEAALVLENYAEQTGFQKAGILMSGKGNRLNPVRNTTRAEAAVMLHRYSKLIVDPQTAQ
ncbi:MAG: S-layer homology domain-containing protein [Lachnospiraceae bacterium]